MEIGTSSPPPPPPSPLPPPWNPQCCTDGDPGEARRTVFLCRNLAVTHAPPRVVFRSSIGKNVLQRCSSPTGNVPVTCRVGHLRSKRSRIVVAKVFHVLLPLAAEFVRSRSWPTASCAGDPWQQVLLVENFHDVLPLHSTGETSTARHGHVRQHLEVGTRRAVGTLQVSGPSPLLPPPSSPLPPPATPLHPLPLPLRPTLTPPPPPLNPPKEQVQLERHGVAGRSKTVRYIANG